MRSTGNGQGLLRRPPDADDVRTPVLVVNFKAFSEALGAKGHRIAEACAKVTEETGASIAVAPATPDIASIAKSVRIPVLAQHVDSVDPGERTGWTPPEAILAAGAAGTLVNHSERKLSRQDLGAAVKRCADLGLEVVCCADDVVESERCAKLGPDFLAIEPPELIGGSVSVTTAKPEVISTAVDRVHAVNPHVRVLCGAGVKRRADVRRAIELGTAGVLVASGVVRAKNPATAVQDLARGL